MCVYRLLRVSQTICINMTTHAGRRTTTSSAWHLFGRAQAITAALPMLLLLLLMQCAIEPHECSYNNGSTNGGGGDDAGIDVDGNGGGGGGVDFVVVDADDVRSHRENITRMGAAVAADDDGGLINCAVRDAVDGACGRSADDRRPNDDGRRLSAGRAKVLSRNKRYVAFPEGSSFSVAFCATLGFVGNPSFIYFSWAINWGVAYELPNQTWILSTSEQLRKPLSRPVVLRRQRRELYGRLETAIDSMGYDGRQCILRALCESTQYFFKQGSNMVEELLRTIFSLPRSKVLSFEPADLHEYDAAHRRGQNRAICPEAYPRCGMSLIEMALGEYSKQQPFGSM